MLEKYNEVALDYYLRGEGGETMRREAEAELYRRGQQSAKMSENEMVEALEALGYTVIAPDEYSAEAYYDPS